MKKIIWIAALGLFPFTGTGQINNPLGVNTESTGTVDARSTSTRSISHNEEAITGFFTGTVDLNPGAGTINVASQGGSDIYVQRLLGSQYLWVRTIGGTGNDKGVTILQKQDAIYVTGTFEGTVDFDPMNGYYPLTSNGGTDVFVMKFDLYGSFLWAKRFGGSGNDVVRSMDSKLDDIEADLYLTGTFRGNVDFDPSANAFSVSSNGGDDCYILKLNLDGEFQWVHNYGGPYDDAANDISYTYDINGNNEDQVVGIGKFAGTVDFNQNSFCGSSYYLSTGNNNLARAIYVMKVDNWGNFKWVKKFDNTSNTGDMFNFGYTVAAHPGTSLGQGELDIYCGGVFDSNMDFDPSGFGQTVLNVTSAQTSGFLLKLDFDGNFEWVRDFTSQATENIPSDVAYTAGRCYLLINGIGELDYNTAIEGDDPDNGEIYTDSWHAQIVKHNYDGTFKWVKSFDGEYTGGGNSIHVFSHACYGRINFCGNFSGPSIDMDPEATSLILNNAGSLGDAFNGSWGDDVCHNKPRSKRIMGTSLAKPNPAINNTQLSTASGEEVSNIEIFNLMGQKMDVKVSYLGSSADLEFLNMPAGIYYIHFEMNGEQHAEKLVITD
jgi:hypothetical protein